MRNIVLIGMPSAGKSTVGVLLAKRLVMEFIDTDLLLQNENGKSLSEMIEDEGEEAFLKREGDLLARLFCTHSVISTGGSAVYSEKGMAHLAELGTLVYLKIDEAEVTARVGNLQRRGVVLHGNQTLEELYRERTALYEAYAQRTVDVTGCSVGGALEKLLDALK